MKKPKIKFDRSLEKFSYLSFPPVEHSDVRRMVGRCHVGESYLAVLRYVLTCLAGGRKAWVENSRFHKRYLIAAVIQHHRKNRVEYRQVMACSREVFVPSYFWDHATTTVLIAPPIIASDLAAMTA